MTSELDLERLSELQQHLGQELSAIVATLVRELDHALAAIDVALRDHDLAAAALAAHAARNSALMIDARGFLAELDVLESDARREDLDRAVAAGERLRASWPRLRSQLGRAGQKSR